MQTNNNDNNNNARVAMSIYPISSIPSMLDKSVRLCQGGGKEYIVILNCLLTCQRSLSHSSVEALLSSRNSITLR